MIVGGDAIGMSTHASLLPVEAENEPLYKRVPEVPSPL